MSEENFSGTHSFIMENRKKLSLNGVCEVESFDENIIILKTAMGGLTVKGERLHISGFNRETGDLSVDGLIYAAAYNDDRPKGSVFSRIFK